MDVNNAQVDLIVLQIQQNAYHVDQEVLVKLELRNVLSDL